MTAPRSSTITLITTLYIMSRDIQSDDGVASSALAKASDRLAQLQLLVNHAYPLIKAAHDAEHSRDGRTRKKRDIDILLAEFEGELITKEAGQ